MNISQVRDILHAKLIASGIATRECVKCHKLLPITSFYDGYIVCKSCKKSDMKAYDCTSEAKAKRLARDATLEAKARQAAYDKTPEGKARYKRHRATEHGKNKQAEATGTMRRKYPEKVIARNAVASALRKGTLVKQPCETCGTTTNVEAHHEDYSKPLDVTWLCSKHHREHHA